MKFLDKSERERLTVSNEKEIEELRAKIQALEIQLAVARSELERSFRPLSQRGRDGQ